MDLTPFAGILSNGQPHTVSLSVFNANGYFSATATLLIYEDHNSSQVTGGLTRNTVRPVNPTVTENLSNNNGNISGTVDDVSTRFHTIAGYVNTSHGRVDTRVDQTLNFGNRQAFTINSSLYEQKISQSTDTQQTVTTVDSGNTTTKRLLLQYPLIADISVPYFPDGSFNQATSIIQVLSRIDIDSRNGHTTYSSNLLDYVAPTDTLEFDNQGNLTGHTDQRSTHVYDRSDSNGNCYNETIKARSGVLTSVKGGNCQ